MTNPVIDFQGERERHEQLLGREDVIAELDRLLQGDGPSRGWVLVKGGPGMGKSALLAHYMSRLEAAGRGVPHHFLRRGVEDWERTEIVRDNLAAQVERLFPAQPSLPQARVDPDSAQVRPESRLREVLQRVSQEVLVLNGERLVLVIDGLDEAEADGSGVNPLQRFLPHTLPRGVWILCASRPTYPHLAWLEAREGVHCIDLDDKRWAASNETVVQRFWVKAASGFQPPLAPEFVTEAIRRAEGNILYAVKLAEWLRERPTERRAEQLPRGLEAFLVELWQSIRALSRELRALVTEGLGLVAAAREALPLSVLASVAGWDDESAKEQFLSVSRQFLLEEPAHWLGERAYRPFHESFRAFILSRLGEESTRQHHRRLAEKLCGWDAEAGLEGFRRRYALRHAVVHHLEAGDQERALATCVDLGYLREKCQELGVAAVEEDLLRTAKTLGGNDPAFPLWELHRAVQAESHWLRKEPAALVPQLYNRLLCMGWTGARVEQQLRVPGGLPALRLRHPVRMGAGEIRTLFGHEDTVRACALTPDGRLALSASHDGVLMLWDLQAGRELVTLPAHSQKVTACALDASGRLALSASWDGTLKVWDLQAQRELATLAGHAGGLTACALTPDGRFALSGSWDRTLKLWDVQARCERATLTGHTGSVWSCALTPDARLALSASRDRTLKLWDLQSGHEVATLTGHTSEVTACALTPDGRFAFSASDDRTLKLWDLRKRRELATLTGHEAFVWGCAISSDCHLAVSVSRDRTLKLWDLRARRERATFTGHEGGVTACALTPDGHLALSASEDRTVKLWDLQDRHERATLQEQQGSVDACAVTADGRLALSLSFPEALTLWDLQDGRELAALTGPMHHMNACAVTPDGRLALAVPANDLKLWSLRPQGKLMTLSQKTGPVTAWALTPGGRLAHVPRAKATMRWNAENRWEPTVEFPVRSCALTPDGRLGLFGSPSGEVLLWDFETESEQARFPGHEYSVRACALSPNRRLALSASEGGELKLWDLQVKVELATLTGHEDAVNACGFTLDGRFALSASDDRTLKLWDLRSLTCVQTLFGCSSFNTLAVAQDLICAGDMLGNLWVLMRE